MKSESSSLLPADLEKELRGCKSLPSLPAVAIKVIEASKDPDIGLREISAIISSDPALAAKILKIANSPMYSQRRTANNLREALTLLGFNAALTISLSFTLLHSLKSHSKNKKSTESNWKRPILSAVIARLLGSQLRVPKLEDLFLAGLLQDIGILVLDVIENTPYPDNGAALTHSERIAAEIALYNIDHSAIGAWLLSIWKLPKRLINAVKYSHSVNQDLMDASSLDVDFHHCLNFSGVIADLWLEDNDEETLKTTMDAAQMFLGLDKAGFNKLIMDINNELPEISNLFDINIINENERDRVLDEARDLLLERSIHFIKRSDEDRRELESISERVKNVEKINQLDHLTTVYNRRHIEQLLDEEFEYANINRWPLSLAFIDIDNFKNINDTYGHLAGDEILKLIAKFFEKNIRETDVLARYGGDEFLLMLPGATSDIAQSMLTRLLNLFKEEPGVNVKGEMLTTTLSIGLATHLDKHDFESVKKLIAATDEALYKAKQAGKNGLAVY